MANLKNLPWHYSFTNLPSVFDEEALTALELCGRLASKVNEIIKAYNSLDDETREKLAAQDKEITEALATLTEKLPPYISEWLEEHPEVTTTLQDGEIQIEKLHDDLKNKVVNGYVTPEMYGYTGTGCAAPYIQEAVNNPDNLPVLLSGNYELSQNVNLNGGKTLIIDGTVTTSIQGNYPPLFVMDGPHNRITGKGSITGKGRTSTVAIMIAAHGKYSFYNEVSVKDIRECSRAISFECAGDKEGACYFNHIHGITFTNCNAAIYMYGSANGNKIENLTCYGCGVAKNPWDGAITLDAYEDEMPQENMFLNISTTNATDCSSIAIKNKARYNYFGGLQFENGGPEAYGIYSFIPETFTNNVICGLIDINNNGSIRGVDNTWLMAFGGRNEMPAIKTREQYRPCGFKYALKKDSTSPAFGDGSQYTVARVTLPPYAVANINLRGMLVSSAAGDIATGNTSNLIVRAKSDGSIVPMEDGAFAIQSDGWINYRTPDAGVGTAHYTTCFVEMDVITTTRDTSKAMTPGHYGVSILPNENFKEYKGDW